MLNAPGKCLGLGMDHLIVGRLNEQEPSCSNNP